MRIILFIITAFVMTGLYAGDKVQDSLEKRLQELDRKYLKAKRKYLADARDDYKKLKVAETKKGNLDRALEYRKRGGAIEARIAKIDAAMKKAEPAKVEETVNTTSNIKEMEKALGYKLSYVIRMREHPDAVKCEATGHYYKYFDNMVTWEEAREKCKAMGGHLATINSHDELAFVLSLSAHAKHRMAFLGMKVDFTKNQWVQVTGEKSGFKGWARPVEIRHDAFYGVIAQGAMYPSYPGWGPIHSYVCEWPK